MSKQRVNTKLPTATATADDDDDDGGLMM